VACEPVNIRGLAERIPVAPQHTGSQVIGNDEQDIPDLPLADCLLGVRRPHCAQTEGQPTRHGCTNCRVREAEHAGNLADVGT